MFQWNGWGYKPRLTNVLHSNKHDYSPNLISYIKYWCSPDLCHHLWGRQVPTAGGGPKENHKPRTNHKKVFCSARYKSTVFSSLNTVENQAYYHCMKLPASFLGSFPCHVMPNRGFFYTTNTLFNTLFCSMCRADDNWQEFNVCGQKVWTLVTFSFLGIDYQTVQTSLPMWM